MNRGRLDRGYPKSGQNTEIYILPRLSGKGGGGGGNYLGTTGTIIEYDVSKYDIYNRLLLLKNTNIAIYEDGGPDPELPGYRLLGDQLPYWIAIGIDTSLTEDEIKAQGLEFIDEELPFEIEITEDSLPQPTDDGWDNKFYLYIWWGSADYVYPSPIGFPTLDVIKHDYDIKI